MNKAKKEYPTKPCQCGEAMLKGMFTSNAFTSGFVGEILKDKNGDTIIHSSRKCTKETK
jgi:hypothetical protein